MVKFPKKKKLELFSTRVCSKFFFSINALQCIKLFIFRLFDFFYQEILPKIFYFIQVYDAINEEKELPDITYPDSDASKAIVEFHACKIIFR